MDFGQPNSEVGYKMANGQLVFLTLHVCSHTIIMCDGNCVKGSYTHI